MFVLYLSVPPLDVQSGEPLRLHGEYLPGGKDQLLREARGRVPEDGCHVGGNRQHLPLRRRLLRSPGGKY